MRANGIVPGIAMLSFGVVSVKEEENRVLSKLVSITSLLSDLICTFNSLTWIDEIIQCRV